MTRPSASDLEKRLATTRRNQADASNPDFSVWVSANAGTGKTHVLTMRVLRLLLAGTRPEAILCLTYTKAAAAEMSKRIFDELAKWVIAPPDWLAAALEKLIERAPTADEMDRSRTLFTDAIETPGGLKIQTIHAFAERLLQRFPLEAGVSPGFCILDEEEARALTRGAIDSTLAAATREPTGALGAALKTAIAYASEDRFDEVLGAALAERDWLRAAAQMGFSEVEALLRRHFGVEAASGRHDVAARLADVICDGDLWRLKAALEGGAKTDFENASLIAEAIRAPTGAARIALLKDYFLTGTGEARARLMTTAVARSHPDLDTMAKRSQTTFVALSQELKALDAITASMALYRLADDVMQRYSEAKDRRSALDFDDLIARTSSLLRVRQSAEWVLYKLDSGIAHILVDESQDTAPAQWRIIQALAGEFFSGAGARESVRTLFAVGDEKQSIYSFQGAEAEQFARMGRYFMAEATAAGTTWRSVPLTLSFRTVEPILRAVDSVFADPARAPGVTATEGRIEHQASRAGQAGLVEVWPTEVYVDPVESDPWTPLAEGTQSSPVVRLADRIADTIQGWLRGAALTSEGRPILPGDILILVRKRAPFAAPMTAALKARKIPVAGADRIRLTEQIAIKDLMALGDFLTLPEDDLSLAAVLKSPMFGLDDDDLLLIAAARKGTLWRALLAHAEDSPRLAAAAATLKDWRRRADFQPPFELLSTLLGKDGMRAKLISRLGPDAAEAIDELENLALTYDDGAPPSLSGFLAWLREGTREVKRDMDHGRNEVRVMTVHGAKGLEAPIVILPDTCTTGAKGSRGGSLVTLEGAAPPETPQPFAWCVKGTTDLPIIAQARAVEEMRETAERNRLLYVAMTRARDRLYVTGFEGKRGPQKGCWYEMIREALRPHLIEQRAPDGGQVWQLAASQTAPHEKSRAITVVTAAALALPGWAAVAAPREPQLAVPLAPSRLAPYEIDEEGEPSAGPAAQDPIAEPPAPSPRWSTGAAASSAGASDGSRFLRGTLTHALLQYLPGMERSEWQRAAHAFVARRGSGVSAATQASIVKEAIAVLTLPHFAPLFGPDSQAEVPIVAEIPRPRGAGPPLRLTGQIDRLADIGHEILIVDYKTNRPPPTEPARVAEVYLYQLAAYRLALTQIFAKPVRAAILWTSIPALMEIPDVLLDDFAARLWSLDPSRLDA